MCILFNPEVVMNNAFFAKDNSAGSYMDIKSLQQFCSIVHTKIINDSAISSQEKYVYFKVDEDDVADFCRRNRNFVRGVNKVYSTSPIEQAHLEKINAIYSKEIRHSLEAARKEFAAN